MDLTEAFKIKLREIMTKPVITVSESETASKCAILMKEKDIGGLIVLVKDKPVGIVTEHDLVKRVLASGTNPVTVKVNDFMSTPLVTAAPDMDIEEAVELMRRRDIRRLVVLDGEELIGIVTSRDILNYMRSYVDSRLRDLIFVTSWW